MKLQINPRDIRWWFWLVTLIFIILALFGWQPAYYTVIAISALQVIFFLVQEKSISAYPVQIRIVYLVMALFGLWPGVGFFIYLILLIGTIMVTFFGRCVIALVLKYMPWNKTRPVRLN
jgi:hypothetical protein